MIEVRTEQDDVTIIAADRHQFVTLRLAGGSLIRLSVSVGGDDRYHVSADLDRGQAVSFSAHDEDFNPHPPGNPMLFCRVPHIVCGPTSVYVPILMDKFAAR
jgi:hypothetical protein